MTTASSAVQEHYGLQAPAGGAGPLDVHAPSPVDVVAMLRRRTVLIGVLFTFGTALVFGGFVVWAKYFPGYRAECLIECVSNIPEADLSLEQERLRQEEHERFVKTQALFLKSPRILSVALQANAVRETQWWKSVQARPWKEHDEHLIELTDELAATAVRGTNYLRVSMVCRDRSDPAIIVNEAVRQWYDEVRRRAAEEYASESLETAQAELEELDSRIEAKRSDLRALASRLPPGAQRAPGFNITSQQVAQYGEQVANLSLELAQLEQYRQIYNDPQGVAVTAEDRALVEEDPQVAQLRQAVFLLEQQRVADEKVFGREHAESRRLDAQLETAQDRLAELRLEKLRERREDIREATNTAYLNTQHALFLAQENLAEAEAALADQDRMLFNYLTLEEELNKEEEYGVELENYTKSLARVVRQQSAVRVNVAQPAIQPLRRHSPSIFLIPIGVLLALLSAAGIGLGLEMLDTSVRTSQDIVRHLDLAVLGAIPDTDDEEVEIERVATAVSDSPRSMVAETFRRVRTNLQFSSPPDRQRSVLITSPQAEDGKTTVACNLAMALAQGQRRVLLIDANFRRPALQNVFTQLRIEGLSNILVGEGSLESSTSQTNLPTLDVLASGPIPPNPAELLGSEACRALLEEAVSRYDRVILDTAPVLLASDALMLGAAVDGAILVVRAKENSRGAARRAHILLRDVGTHLFGAVLNAAQVARGGYFREQLRAYYDYQAEAETAAPTRASEPKPPETSA
ncbi:MAG: polysaccharide biosynthesis tyrosine autokinase [Planctomycetota bacterium]|jgi:capsular exopolysaccharide synthesis family protein